MNRRSVVAVLVSSGFFSGLFGCQQNDPVSRDRGVAAAVVVRRGALEDRFPLTGDLEATRSDFLRAPKAPNMSASIKWITEDGATVKKGDKIVEFDTSSLSGSLADKSLALQRGQTELASETAQSSSAAGEKQMEVDRKRTALEKARIEADVPADLRPGREHQEKQLAVAKAADALKKAEDDLAAQQRGSRLERRIKEVALTRATRELKELESSLDDLALRAPRDGLVQIGTNFRDGTRKYQIGDMAYTGMEVAKLPDLSVMHVSARLHDVDEGAIRAGMKAECRLDAYPSRPLMGTVESISPVARPEGRDGIRRIFSVIVKLDKTEAFMLPGMSVRVEVIRRKVNGALLVPRNVLTSAGGKTVARLANGLQQPVEIEFCSLQECALKAGLAEGTSLAVPVPQQRKSS
jgi:HlyD family secretion protein